MQRAARIGDGFIFGGRTETVVAQWDHVRELVSAAGRAVDGFGGETVVFTTRGPEAVAERIETWGAAGGTHAAVNTMGHGFGHVDEHLAYLSAVAAAIGR